MCNRPRLHYILVRMMIRRDQSAAIVAAAVKLLLPLVKMLSLPAP